ncbi:ParM/StbA family protein [Niallia sp. NCCP-28]|uniref:ParM/StbA family protein n=1 Tax=Niallia sp. NCCP-28 TaxID=2934712 RepID=UPI0020BE6F9D|nr:hypothetical protein [Niallia sp. NCCP-28]
MIDGGNNGGKTVGWHGYDYYKTNICDWFERNVDEKFSDDDMEFEIDGRKGFAGPIAAYEDEFGASSMYGDSKAHGDMKIRALISANRYIEKFCPGTKELYVVTGQPIKGHVEEEKEKIQSMLCGHHKFAINGEQKEIIIHEVKVAAEGSMAFWSADLGKDALIVDVGSGTVNAAEIKDKKHINRSSDTFNFGTDTISQKSNYASLARGVATNLTQLKWNRRAVVHVCGGIAEKFDGSFKQFFPNARILIPKYKQKTKIQLLHPVYANAVGGFELAKKVYK